MEDIYPVVGTLVIITLRNNLCIEGVVEGWNKKMVILKAPNSENQIVIYKPEKNILFAKLIYSKTKEVMMDTADLPAPIEEEEIDVLPNEPFESLAEKHKERVCDLRSKIAAHLQNPIVPISGYNVGYGVPDFFQR